MPYAVQIRPHVPPPQPFIVPPPTHRLSPTVSSVLDLIRFTAALLVVIAHLGHPEVNNALPNLQILGDIAVPVFFVLSGFVIRYITLARPHTLRQFLIDRAARIYSIALPAMALTLFVTAIIARLAPIYFQQNFAGTCDHSIARITLNLTFLSQSWSHNTIPFINAPFWSLSYEVLFYIAYGLAFYLRGITRILTLLLWTLIAGPQILFLLPIWLLGCIVYDLQHALRDAPVAAKILRLVGCTSAVLCAISARVNPAKLAHLPSKINALPTPLTLLQINPMRASLFAFTAGIFAAFALLIVLLLTDLVHLPRKSSIHPWLTRFRRIADGTFAIYLMHYPLMAFAAATGLLRPNSPVLNIATAATICLLLIAAAAPLDRFKLRIRSTLLVLIPMSPTQEGASQQPAPSQTIVDLPTS